MTQGSATRRDFRMIRNTTLRYNGVARRTDGTVIDLTGGSMAWRIGLENLTETKITVTTADDITVTDATAGKYELLLAPAKTADLNPDLYPHRAEVTEAAGDILTVLTGELRLQKDLP